MSYEPLIAHLPEWDSLRLETLLMNARYDLAVQGDEGLKELIAAIEAEFERRGETVP